MKEYVFPQAVVCSHLAEDPQNLLKKKPLQIGLSEKDITKIANGGYVILDYGKEMRGGIRILNFTSNQGGVRIRFGESLTECCAEIGGEKNATNDHALRDMQAELPNYSDMPFGETGFRFVRLDVTGEVSLKSVIAVNHILNKAPMYEYNGTDKRIKDIFQAAKRTVDLCAADGYVWDGIKRDKLVWVGDMHPEMLALTALYGKVPALERSLTFIKDQTPLPGWMNRWYPAYSMWWMIIVADYYAINKNTGYTKKQLSYIQGLLKQMDECIDENGEMHYPDYFVDWPTRGQVDEKAGVRAINVMALKKTIELFQEFGLDTSLANDLLQRLVKVEIKVEKSKQVLGLKYFAVGLTEEDQQKLIAGGARGMSTFMSYYILKAVASFDKKKAISMMKEYYGAMLDKGATTFFEDFDLDWAANSCRLDEFPKEGQRDIHGDFGAFCYQGFRHSLCHGWSAGVIQFIKEEC